MNALATVNVNGVRAAATKGLLEWLAATDARAVCLQEVRARPDELPAAFLAALLRHAGEGARDSEAQGHEGGAKEAGKSGKAQGP